MRVLDRAKSESTQSGAVDVTRWEQFGLEKVLPFGAMWYSVPPGADSPRDCHPEIELSVVLAGAALVEASGSITPVECGSAFLLDSDEAHVVHNSSPDRPLLIFSAYWMPVTADV